MKRILCMGLALWMLAGLALAEPSYFRVGDAVKDFTLTTYNGQTVTLSELLSQKEWVLLHFFATWCGGCEEEMPRLQAAYETCGDQVAFIAVTIEPQDTDKKLATFAVRRGLTFPIARDTAGLKDAYPVYGVPLSVFIDHTGTVAHIKEGTFRTAEDLLAVLTKLTGPQPTE